MDKSLAVKYEVAPQSMCVQELPMQMQPREIFDRLGAEQVPDAVLLAILIRSGVPGQNVSELAQTMLMHYGSLTALARTSVKDLQQFKGIGPVTAQLLKAALELAQRLTRESFGERPVVATPEQAAAVLRERARVLQREVFWGLMLDSKNRLIGEPQVIFKGTLDHSTVHPRELFKKAVECSCANIVLAHNHPSGDPAPSTADVQITKQLVDAGTMMGIRILDHIIIGHRKFCNSTDFTSLRESGLIDFKLKT